MTHGFDDQGRQFDADGNLRDWWSKKSAGEYDKRRKAVVDQYSVYAPLPGQHVNGELTQGENIADIGGLKLAYAAFQKALDKHPEERNKKIDGLTPEQRFLSPSPRSGGQRFATKIKSCVSPPIRIRPRSFA